jgi:hypothetical protein
MGISFTRFSAAVVVALQWLAVIVMIQVSHKNERIFADFNATLPDTAVIASQATKPLVLVPIALLTTAIVMVAETLLKSATGRSVIQVTVLFLWLALTCFCLIALELPLLTILKDISKDIS